MRHTSLARILLSLCIFLLLMGCKERPIQDEVFYFVLPDRFHNGDPSNDTGGIPGTRDDHGYDAEDSAYFHGGDLKGLRSKLLYLKRMGVTAIWMAPVFKNAPAGPNSAGYHGYWIKDYTQVDPHLGTNEELADLIRDAHRYGLKVYFDIVVNHTADIISYEECHNPDGTLIDGLSTCEYVPLDQEDPTRTPFVPAGLENAKAPAWLNDIAYYNNRGDSTFSGESSLYGDFFGLDDLNTKDPVVVQGMVDIFKFWISEFKIDGFRLDTVKHVDIEFWQQWTPAIQAHAEAEGIDDFFIFGEVFDGGPRVLSKYTTEGKLPSVLDFGVYFAARDVFAGNQAPTRLADLFAEDDLYNDADSDAALLMNFVSNHDVGRFGHEIQKANGGESDEQHLARLKLGYALNFFGRGIPVIYYGDEQGFTGDGNDKDSREDMMPSLVDSYNDNDLIGTDATTADDNFERRHPMYRALSDFSRLLKQHKALRQGRFFVRHAASEAGIFAFSRVLDGRENEYLVVMNTATTEQSISLPATSSRYSRIYPRGRSLNSQGDEISLTLDPLSFVILKGRDKIGTPDVVAIELGLEANIKVSGRVEVPAIVSWEADTLLPMSAISFEVSVNGGDFHDIGYDGVPDYKVFYNADQHQDGTLLTFRAVAHNSWTDSITSEEVTVEVGAEPGLKVIFKKPDNWGNDINIYYWNADPAPGVDWPGIAIEHLGNGWYSYQFQDGVQFANLIFNDGTGNQTGDLFRDSDGCYIDFNWVDTCDPDTSGGSGEPGMIIYFQKPLNWNTPNIYYWNAAGAPGWPGNAMESLGDDWYSFQFPDDVNAANIIFNDGTNQTGDLYREGTGCYSIATDTWTDACAIPGFKVYVQKPADWTNINIYYWNVAGSDASVSWPGVPMESLGDDWFTYQFPAGATASNVIFNDGEGAQTSDLYRESDGCFDFGAQEWSDDCDYPRPGLLVRFKKPAGWGADINIYYWNAGSAPAVNWPGLETLALGDDWYEFQFPAGVTVANIIFNDGQGNQTSDLYRVADGCYGENGDTWSDTCDVPDGRVVEISNFAAHWLNGNQLVWNNSDNRASQFKLLGSLSASLEVVNNALEGVDTEVALTEGATLDAATAEKFRHLADYKTFSLSIDNATAENLLKSQLVVAAYDDSGNLLEATRVQTPGAIDSLYTYNGQLGAIVDSGNVTLKLWAPTAQQVSLKLYDADKNQLETVNASTVANGLYTFTGDSSWLNRFYRYSVEVYHPISDAVESYEVTDPYSLSLSMNSQFSQIVDLSDNALKPDGWDSIVKTLPAYKDISVYEGHVRDFSAHDAAVPVEHRGKYKAFTYNGVMQPTLSAGMAHLQALQTAGLTHFHVLPVNDLGSINENPAERVDIDDPYSRLCDLTDVPAIEAGCTEFAGMTIREAFEELKAADPTNNRIQAINYDQRLDGFPGVDGFNWGYDPYHFNVPEGSYASTAEGAARILEFREMVKALDQLGLKVVVDVVFNHTYASGLNTQSVLDKVVPGYYHRRNANSGAVETSTCCDNTAAEHVMMEHLMVQTLKNWATNYKVDAFRFDLMGHHPKAVMERLLAEMSDLTLVDDGVDGANIYFYGEGWDFGEVAGNQRFDQATQFNMAGTGVGTFNDRLRDAVRGGNFSNNQRAQGFANGNGTFWNGVAGGASSVEDQADRIRIGLAGNLQDYPFEDNGGNINTGLGYSGVGYNLDPQENVVYVDKHDNETLWDNTQGKLPDGFTMDDRVRVHAVNQAFVNYSQGIPFHQMGSDLLRSKSLDRDSFDAGDWFNKVDFTKQDNNWAVGLPSEDKNGGNWDNIRPILSNPNIDPQPSDIAFASALFQDQLAVRYSSPLFRLDSPEDVMQRVSFLNTGAGQTAGLIAMLISDGSCTGADLDAERDGLLIVFNADDDNLTFSSSALTGLNLSLHSVQQVGVDAVVKGSAFDSALGEVTVPGLTVAVFEAAQSGGQGTFPCNSANGQVIEPGFTVYFQKPASWGESINVYYWNTLPAAPAIGWPGAAAENLGEDSTGNTWYAFTLPDGVTESNIIFNDGAGNQTTDLFRAGNGCYDTIGGWTDTCTLPGLMFWFEKPADWADTINLYYWGVSASDPGWPGTPMQDLGSSWYFFQMPEGVRSANLIFNDGSGSQTSDLNRSKNGCYSLDTGWSDTADCQIP